MINVRIHFRDRKPWKRVGTSYTRGNGRTIVVPLSGGFDSRLIVLMLKRLGYARMIVFSYGRPGNKESEISREVASALGIQWEFVPYSNAAWHRWSDTEEWRAEHPTAYPPFQISRTGPRSGNYKDKN